MLEAGYTSLSLSFAQEWQDVKLFEVSEELLAEMEKDGKFSIKGEATQEAVFCTTNRTFTIKYLENSNSLFPISMGSNAIIPALVDGHVGLRPLIS